MKITPKDCFIKTDTTFKKDPFRSISSHFFGDYSYIFHKNQVQKVILKCLTCLNLIWIKGYNIKHAKGNFRFFCNFEKKGRKFKTQKWPFYDPFGNFFANYTEIFQKTEIQTVILRCLVDVNLNWIKSQGIILVQIIFFHA